ncbi:TetR/AcrR family transcriptional regulator [Rhodococcus sp. NCIMB 12038]|uniref:TetR/AcrR family transcriptional regulator n=1 Tax=Rhodococcus sp. NCIMB 12038 TaxID=933800 RepID=UPI000B3D405F|nr:TetR/AcrR family transcriptional regulator [Rhodococcus sp. NCIMB 12038]
MAAHQHGVGANADQEVSAADLRRQKIVARSALLIDEIGYSRTSMDEIARSVKMAKPTIYHYFRSKEEILFSIHEEFVDHLLKLQAEHTVSGMTAEEQLQETMVDLVTAISTHRGHSRVFFEHYRELSGPKRALIAEKRAKFRHRIVALIESCQAVGTFRDTDPNLAALGLIGMCNWSYQWHSPEGSKSPREVAEEFWNLLHGGLQAKSPTPANLRGSTSSS